MMNPEDLCAGDTLGRYELLVPIAKGGTAEVWAARLKGSRGFEKIVAVKVMLAEFSDDVEAESMFLDEARLVSSIRNRNVAVVLDLGEEQNVLFIVMEWIDGEPLNVVAREARGQGGIPLSIVVQIVQQAASGLQAAHELADHEGRPVRLVHRDVSPQNILVGYDGTVKVIDFGVAKATSNQQRTNVGQLKGKIAYMAPEQAFGQPVDRRTDIFALGIVFYQLLTGKHPLRADNEFATLARIRDKKPIDPPSMYLPTIPRAVEHVIQRALAKNPSERFASMLDLSRALEEAYSIIDGGTEELASYMRSLLGHRGEKKRLAIRDALRAADEHALSQNSVPAAFDAVKSLDLDDIRSGPSDSSRGSWPDSHSQRPRSPLSPGLTAKGAPSSGPLERSPSSSSSIQESGKSFPAGPLGGANVLGQSVTEDHLLSAPLMLASVQRISSIPKFRSRPSAGLIMAIVAIVVVLALALWGASGDSEEPAPPTGDAPAKRAW